MSNTSSKSENSSSSGGKRKRSKLHTDDAHRKHTIKIKYTVNGEAKKMQTKQIVCENFVSIKERINILRKQVKKRNIVLKENINEGFKSETTNLMTKVCTIDMNIQNSIDRDSEYIVLSKLLRDVIDELIDRLIYRYPLLVNVVRIPQFIQNIRNFQVPKYVVYMLLLMGSTLLKNDKLFEEFTEERRKRVLKYVTEYMETVISKPDYLSIWTMLVLAKYYAALGILSQYTKYVHLATSFAILMKLHRVDEYCTRAPANQSEDLIVEKELKRRLWWCTYIFSVLLSESTAVQPALQLRDVFVNLPNNDRLWHKNSEFTLPTTLSAKRGDMVLSSQGEFKFDTFASYVMLFRIRHVNVTFINRRKITIAKGMDKDYQCYLIMFKNSMQFQESLVVKFHNELKKILVFGVRNPNIVNVMNIEYFILRYCTLILNSCVANLYIITSEVAYYKGVDIPPERVKLAKIMLIENTIRFTEIFYWLMSKFSLEKFDVELNSMTFYVLKHLMNMEYVKDLSRLNAIINGKNVLYEYFEKLKSTSQLSQTYMYILIGLFNLKKGYDKANAKFRNIPPDFAMKMLSPYDYNPWFVPTGSSFLKKVCCNNTENPKIHDPFLLSRITVKKGLDRNNAFSSRFIKQASKKRFVLAVDLKIIIEELKKLHLPFEELSTSKQTSEKQNAHSISNPTLDDDPQDFYVKFANFDTRPQNITLLSQCKKMIERVFYLILSANAKSMYKNQSPTFEQNLIISSYREAFLSFDFTELLYNPIEQAQRGDKTSGCEFLYKSKKCARFGSAINSMIDD